jgi:hypothetical protein
MLPIGRKRGRHQLHVGFGAHAVLVIDVVIIWERPVMPVSWFENHQTTSATMISKMISPRPPSMPARPLDLSYPGMRMHAPAIAHTLQAGAARR